MEGDRGDGVCCLLEVPEGCSCQVNVLQRTREGVEIVLGKYISCKSVPLGYCSGKEAVFVFCSSCGIWICLYYVWVVESCLAVSRHEVLVGVDV